MEDAKKRTDRKSQSARSRYLHQTEEADLNTADLSDTVENVQDSAAGTEHNSEASAAQRIVDMSWAAEYINDDWEDKFTSAGNYDTKVPGFSVERSASDSDTLSNLTSDPMSVTQEFKAFGSDNDRDILAPDTSDDEDSVKIRDAVTGETIISEKEAEDIRKAAASIYASESSDDEVKIRDAVSGETITSSRVAEQIREAAASRTPVVRDAASMMASADSTPAASYASGSYKRQNPEYIRNISENPDEENSKDEVSGNTTIFAGAASKLRNAIPSFMPIRRSSSKDLDDVLEDIDKGEEEEQEAEIYVEADDRESVFYDEEDDFYDDRDGYYDDSYEEPYEDRYDNRYKAGYDERYEEPYRPRRRDYRDDYYDYEYHKSPLRFIPLVLVIAICVIGFIAARQICYDVPFNSSDYSKISYTVGEGLSDEVLAADLESLGLIDNPLIFRLRCKFYSAEYVPGTYELSPCYSTEKIINILSGYTYGEDE